MQSPLPADKQSVDDLTKEFLVESQEGLDRMERCLTELEVRPGDAELLADIFRAVHTIKGTTGFLALPRLEKLAHASEHLLGLLRDGKLEATPPIVDVLLELLDGLQRVLGVIEATGGEGTRDDDDDAELIATIDKIAREAQTLRESARFASSNTPGDRRGHAAADQTLRVDVETLNRMMNQVGELVLTRNQILQSNGEGEDFKRLTRRLDGVTADLQETVMRARTQPVEHLFQKFPRMVRDLAQQCGRRVRLDFSGQETRLDKSLLEVLKDPLTHAVRNAVDHGIESPEERVRSGKPPEGVVRMCAYREGGQVVIEVEDDGGGISAQTVLTCAVNHGLISAERGRSLSEREALQLVFAPGLSTRDEVTTVSGRGVGLDVVRANVESVGGTVEIESKLGEGSTVRMRVPLTLAIIPALVVRCGGGNFALPRNSINELVLIARSEESQLVHGAGAAKVLWLRDEQLPLIALADLLGAPKDDANGYYVAVVETKGRRFGLVIDDLFDSQEIVVKPLSRVLRLAGVFSGASILGNGELALILDIAGIAARANLASKQIANDEAGAPMAMLRQVA
jgi:two-component system, chemotaxis family, sensor kinase CheA